MVLGVLAKAQHPNAMLEHSIKGYAQGTSYNIKYYSDKALITKQAIDSLLNEIDNSLSIYRTDSKISLFNDVKTKQVKMDQHMKTVIERSLMTYKLTDGYFDITVMPLVNLWGFGSQGARMNPNATEVQEAKSLVGINNLRVRNGYLKKKKKGISIDVNGIAQGYSVDILGEYLFSQGISNYIVEVGGEIVTRGAKPHGDFVVEVQRPFAKEDKPSYKIKLRDKAVTTSGTYEKKRNVNGKYISHHIDPFTGYPIENTTLSVTIIADKAISADAIDNYLMFISPVEAIKFIESHCNMECYLIYFENNTLKELQSSGFNNYIYK